MTRIAIDPFDTIPELLSRLKKPGLLLTCGKEGNPITIGWATLGIVWGKPIFTVLVRPSRYSFGLLRENGDFSVSIPAPGDKKMAKAIAWCGTNSGRDGDKYKGAGITKEEGIIINTPYVAECPIHYECRRVNSNHVLDAETDAVIRSQYYPEGDLHQIWWGEILGAWKAQ
ncbi:MAG: flavin reductase [Spirochaetaceae bacterium]|nr:flavin reductase [Spirochaetaceae bacterium]